MVTVKCQHSGIEFEAASSRTKMHPLIARLKERANKQGLYGAINHALVKVQKEGGYETIEQYVERVDALLDKANQIQAERESARQREEREREQKRQEAKKQREAQNALLRKHGYRWLKIENDEEAQDFENAPATEWMLIAPDEHAISLADALNAIERNVDLSIIRAEIEVRRQAERQAKIVREAEEAQRQAERDAQDEIKKQAQRKLIDQFDAQVRDISERNTEVERITVEMDDYEIIARIGYESTVRSRDNIQRGKINGIACYVIVTGTGYDDDGYYSYYCENPSAAGLTPKQDSGDSTFSRIFGVS